MSMIGKKAAFEVVITDKMGNDTGKKDTFIGTILDKFSTSYGSENGIPFVYDQYLVEKESNGDVIHISPAFVSKVIRD